MTTLIYYMKGHYYMLKHKVFSHFNYQCSCCGSDYIEDLELHHGDDLVWNGHGGRDRYLKAVEILEQGEDHDLELLCSECHDLRDRKIPLDFIREHLGGYNTHYQKEQIKEAWLCP